MDFAVSFFGDKMALNHGCKWLSFNVKASKSQFVKWTLPGTAGC